MIILSDEKFLIANYKRKISKVDELKILDIIYKNTPVPQNINNWLYLKIHLLLYSLLKMVGTERL
jgi:hypothetical protein